MSNPSQSSASAPTALTSLSLPNPSVPPPPKPVHKKGQRGRKAENDIFTEDERKWMEERKDNFRRIGNPTERSLQLDNWVELFEDTFPLGSRSNKDRKAKFRQWFNNKYNYNPKKDLTRASDLPEHIFNVTAPDPTPTGRQLFTAEKKDEVNEKVLAHRHNNGLPHTLHPGMLQRELKADWDKLSDDEKKAYEIMSMELAEKEEIEETERIFTNQTLLPATLATFFREISGQQVHGIGNTAFFVLAAYRDKSGALMCRSSYHSQNAGSEAFIETNSCLVDQLSHEWVTYCEQYIPVNSRVSSIETESVHDEAASGTARLASETGETPGKDTETRNSAREATKETSPMLTVNAAEATTSQVHTPGPSESDEPLEAPVPNSQSLALVPVLKDTAGEGKDSVEKKVPETSRKTKVNGKHKRGTSKKTPTDAEDSSHPSKKQKQSNPHPPSPLLPVRQSLRTRAQNQKKTEDVVPIPTRPSVKPAGKKGSKYWYYTVAEA